MGRGGAWRLGWRGGGLVEQSVQKFVWCREKTVGTGLSRVAPSTAGPLFEIGAGRLRAAGHHFVST
jgi:hypothetical protein